MTATVTEPTEHLRVPAGAVFVHDFPAPPGSDGQPRNVTGWAARGQIKTNSLSSSVLYTWTSGLISCSGTTVTVRIPAAVSSAWLWRAAAYQIEVIDPNDATNIYRVVRGSIFVAPWSMGPAGPTPTTGYGYAPYGTSGYGD